MIATRSGLPGGWMEREEGVGRKEAADPPGINMDMQDGQDGEWGLSRMETGKPR